MISALDLIGNTPLVAKLGINDTLVQLSVGIEDADDLIADLSAALG
jgi:cystathionine beta-lyase/cystathionine gamma-synthase